MSEARVHLRPLVVAVITLAAATLAWGQPAGSAGVGLTSGRGVLAQATTAAATGVAGAVSAAADPAALVATGRRLYTGMCARCHGLNLAATGFGADLRRFPPEDRERFNQVVLEGRQAMPAMKSLLKPADLEALWAYLGSVNGWPAK